MDKITLEYVTNILNWIVAGGSVAIVSWATSWALEKVGWWQKLTSTARSAIILVVSIILGWISVWLLTNPQILQATYQYIGVTIMAIVAWLATQVAHRKDKPSQP